MHHGAAEQHGDQDHQGHDREQQAGQPRAQLKHGQQDEAEHQQIADNGHQAGREQFVQDVDIGGDARDQPADGIAVVIGNVQALEMRHQIAPQVEHGALAGVLHEVRLAELEHEAHHNAAKVDQRQLGDADPGIRRKEAVEGGVERLTGRDQVSIHRHFRQQRTENLRHGIGEKEHHRQRDGAAIRAHVSEQAAHQAPVVGFAEYLFFHFLSG